VLIEKKKKTIFFRSFVTLDLDLFKINMTSIQRINNFIDGQFVPTEEYLESFNPSTEEVIAHIADSSIEDANRAIQAARQAFSSYVKQRKKQTKSIFYSFVQMESSNNR
jgi:hypothetical protein